MLAAAELSRLNNGSPVACTHTELIHMLWGRPEEWPPAAATTRRTCQNCARLFRADAVRIQQHVPSSQDHDRLDYPNRFTQAEQPALRPSDAAMILRMASPLWGSLPRIVEKATA